jgi:hypothetical protein
MRLGNTVIQGTRAAPRLPGEPPPAATVDRVALYRCANRHQTVVPFISTAWSMSRTGAARPTDRLMAGSLRRRDHPDEFSDVLDGRAVAQAEGLISLPDRG